jgi:hypothetical protein
MRWLVYSVHQYDNQPDGPGLAVSVRGSVMGAEIRRQLRLDAVRRRPRAHTQRPDVRQATCSILVTNRAQDPETALGSPRLLRTQAARSGARVDVALARIPKAIGPTYGPNAIRSFSNLASELEPPYGIEP